MPVSAISQPKTSPEKKKSKRISWEEFEKTYLSREDGYKYEWLNGIVEKTQNTMNKKQIAIFLRLLAIFHRLLFGDKVQGGLIPEADLFFGKHHRRPDISWLTKEQSDRMEK